jgi:hypothetical protein
MVNFLDCIPLNIRQEIHESVVDSQCAKFDLIESRRSVRQKSSKIRIAGVFHRVGHTVSFLPSVEALMNLRGESLGRIVRELGP